MKQEELLELMQKWQQAFFKAGEALIIECNEGWITITCFENNGLNEKRFEFRPQSSDQYIKQNSITLAELSRVLSGILVNMNKAA